MELPLTLCQTAVYIRNDLIILYNQWQPFSEWRSQKHIIKAINYVQRNAAHSKFPTNHNHSFPGKSKNRAMVSYSNVLRERLLKGDCSISPVALSNRTSLDSNPSSVTSDLGNPTHLPWASVSSICKMDHNNSIHLRGSLRGLHERMHNEALYQPEWVQPQGIEHLTKGGKKEMLREKILLRC